MKPMCVLLHGAQHDAGVWALTRRYLHAQNYKVWAPSLPGHGKRQTLPALTDIRSMAAWVVQNMPVEQSPVIWIGHSMGSLIALEAARLCPTRTHALVLVATSYPMKVAPSLLTQAEHSPLSAMQQINTWSFHTTSQQRIASNLRMMQRQPARTLVTDLHACNEYALDETDAEAITCPVLFVVAEHDKMTRPSSARRLASRFLRHEIAEIPDCGHHIMSERPQAWWQVLSRFFTEFALNPNQNTLPAIRSMSGELQRQPESRLRAAAVVLPPQD